MSPEFDAVERDDGGVDEIATGGGITQRFQSDAVLGGLDHAPQNGARSLQASAL